MQSLRISTLVVFGVTFFVAIGTFKNIGGLKYSSPIGLYITYLIFPAVCVVVYAISQLVLVTRTLDDRWAIGNIVSYSLLQSRVLLADGFSRFSQLFGFAGYVVGVLVLFVFSGKICDAVSHYIDGTFFFSLCMLLSVMMVYKYWDCEPLNVSPPSPPVTDSRLCAAITKEDLEFSVGSKGNVWEVKDPLLPPNADYMEEDTTSNYHGAGGSLIGGHSGNNYYTPSTYGAFGASPGQQRAAYAPSSVSGHGHQNARGYNAQAGYSGPS